MKEKKIKIDISWSFESLKKALYLKLRKLAIIDAYSNKEKNDTLIGLRNSAGFIRQHLGKVIKIRKIPELTFVEDANLDYAIRIESILADMKSKGELD